MATSGNNTININLPTAWSQLSKAQLYYLYALIADYYCPLKVHTSL